MESEVFEAEIRAMVGEGRKIEAIKRYREATGAGLAEAKASVEAIDRGASPIGRTLADPEGGEEQVIALLHQGRKIPAIKLYRELTGVGLARAKADVEAMARAEGLPDLGTGTAGGLVQVMVLALLVAIGVGIWLALR